MRHFSENKKTRKNKIPFPSSFSKNVTLNEDIFFGLTSKPDEIKQGYL